MRGRVQGVFFRDSVRRRARSLNLTGTAENAGDGTLRAVAEGEESALLSLLEYLKKGPPLAKIETVEPNWKEPSGEFKSFTIVYSSFFDRL